MAFHNSLERKDLLRQNLFGLPPRTEYSITKPFDFWLTDSIGTKLSVNPASIALSRNGAWMVFEIPKVGIFRANMSTMALTPITYSPTPSWSFGLAHIPMAISNDGLLVATVLNQSLQIHDLSGCQQQAYKLYESINFAGCRQRDLWEGSVKYGAGLQTQFVNPLMRGNVRFIDNDNLKVTIRTNIVSSTQFSSAEYVLTAPGGELHKLGLLGMGDSYISGEGAHDYKLGTDTDNNKCHLSKWSHPLLLGNMYFDSYDSVACAGATTNDIKNFNENYGGQTRPKVQEQQRGDIATYLHSLIPGALNQNEFVTEYKPKTVLLSIGGNDIRFADIVKLCVSPVEIAHRSNCYATYEDRKQLAEKIRSTFGDLRDTYGAIKRENPAGTLFVTGYPSVIKENGNCGRNVMLTAEEAKLANDIVKYLNLTIERAAHRAGATYVDIEDALEGGRLCEGKAYYMNGATAGNDKPDTALLSFIKPIGNESFHPTKSGHERMAETIKLRTRGFSATTTPSPLSANRPTLEEAGELLTDKANVRTGLPTPVLKWDDQLTDDLVVRGKAARLNLKGLEHNSSPSSPFTMVLHSDPVELGTILTDANGDVSTDVTVPVDTPPGYHTLHLYGKNIAGEDIDIAKVLYVAASVDDYDGNGISNDASDCKAYPDSGIDYDKDDVDDACDGHIGEPPLSETSAQASQKSEARQTVDTGKVLGAAIDPSVSGRVIQSTADITTASTLLTSTLEDQIYEKPGTVETTVVLEDEQNQSVTEGTPQNGKAKIKARSAPVTAIVSHDSVLILFSGTFIGAMILAAWGLGTRIKRA